MLFSLVSTCLLYFFVTTPSCTKLIYSYLLYIYQMINKVKSVYKYDPWEIETWSLQGVNLYIETIMKGKCILAIQEVAFIER